MSLATTIGGLSGLVLKKTAEQDIANMEGTKAELLKLAQSVVDAAQAIAPYNANDSLPHYRDQIVAEVGDTKDGVVGRVNAKDFKSNWIEFGTVNWPAQHVLTRAAEAALGQTVTAHKRAEGV